MAKTEVQRAFVYSFEEMARTICNNYLDNVEAYCNKEKIKDPITEEEMEPDEQLMRSIEEQIGISENAKNTFRQEILIRISSYARKGKQFEYMMQLGSGTVDLYPGITYLYTSKKWSWGAQTLETVRLGMNDHHYKFGNDYRATAWTEYNVNPWLAPSFTVRGHSNGNIIGRDPLLDPFQEPTRDPNDYAGTRVDVLMGVSLYSPKGRLKGARLSLEGGVPVIQSLDGPQPKIDWMANLNASYTFGGKKRREQSNQPAGIVMPEPKDSGKGGEASPGKGR